MDGLSQHTRFKKIESLKYPALLDNKVKSLLNQSEAIASFLRFHTTHPQNNPPDHYFNELIKDLMDGKTLAEVYPKGFDTGDLEPSLSVLLNFIENLHSTTEKFNLRWQEYPKWYYKNIVGVKTQPIVGDKVWVVFTNNGAVSTTVPIQTKFKVNRTRNKTYFYKLIEETEVHAIQIEKMFILKLIKDKNNVNKPHFIKSIQLNELILKNNNIESESAKNVDIGIRVSSPILILREGIRTVKLTFYPRNKQWTEKSSDEIITLTSAFKLSISTINGWENISEYVVQEEDGKVNIELQLPDSFPSTSSCNYNVHEHYSFYPTINVCLNIDSNDYLNTSFEKFQLSKVKIETYVRNITNLKIYNELGKIDNSKPFAPFGINTEKGAWFTIGNYESNIKATKNISLNFEWDQLPDHPLGLQGYYADYNRKITTNSFQVAVNYLSDFQWKPIKGKNTFPLFSSKQNSLSLDNLSSIGPIDVKKMEPINISENDYEYALQTRNGFINFLLVSPEMGFGETVYRRVFTEQMMRNARKKQKYPSIQPPIQPLLKRITLDYEAEEIIDIRTHLDDAQSSIESIVPLNNLSINSLGLIEPVSFIPDLHERNLIFKLTNVQENIVLNLFFEVFPKENKDVNANSLHYQREKIRHISLYLGNPHYWEKMPLSFIKKDETIALLISGCMQIQFPRSLSPSLFDKDGSIWLRIGYDDVEDVEFPDLKSVHVNAAQLELIIPSETGEEIEINSDTGELMEESIIPGLANIKRITPFFNGRSEEKDNEMLMRMSEFAAHKGRAVTPKDYENLILQAFPEISKVKWIINQKNEKKETVVYLVVLPSTEIISQQITYPLTPAHVLYKIERYINDLSSSYVSRVNILNPVYEEIIIRCRIQLKGYFSVKRRKLLSQRLNEFIAPWIHSKELPQFGFSLNLEKAYNAIIKEFGAIISISDFSAIRIEKENESFILHDCIYKKTDELFEDHIIEPSEAHAILIPSDNHIFYWDSDFVPDLFGIDEMGIGKSFIISNKKL